MSTVTEPKKTGFRATIKGLFKRDEEQPQEPQVLAEPEGPPPPSATPVAVDPKLENDSVLQERRSSIQSQKTENGKWKVDMRYVGNYTESIDIMRKEKAGHQEEVVYADPQRLRLTAEQLRANSHPQVNPAMKEQYLSEQEFQQIFGMDKAAFNKLPNWKRLNTKKEKGLN